MKDGGTQRFTTVGVVATQFHHRLSSADVPALEECCLMTVREVGATGLISSLRRRAMRLLSRSLLSLRWIRAGRRALREVLGIENLSLHRILDPRIMVGIDPVHQGHVSFLPLKHVKALLRKLLRTWLKGGALVAVKGVELDQLIVLSVQSRHN